MKTNKDLIRFASYFLIGVLLLFLRLEQPNAQKDTLRLAQVFEMANAHFQFESSDAYYQRILQIESAQSDLKSYPQLSLNGEGTYQSDVVSFPFEFPGIDPLDLPHLSAQLNLQLNQSIYDGGLTKAHQKLQKASNDIDRQQIQIKKDQLKQQLSEVYFQILLLQNVKESLGSSMLLVRQKKKSLKAAADRGVAMESDVLRLEAELIRIQQDSAQYDYQIKAMKETLSELLGRNMDHTLFQLPEVQVDVEDSSIQDPKLKLLQLQKQRLAETALLSKAKNNPKANAFARGGVGYPNPFNLFDDNWSPFFMAGIQASWPIWDWGRHQKEKELIQVRSQLLNNEMRQQKIQIRSGLQEQIARIQYLENALEQDRNLLEKRKRIRELTSLRLDKGVSTTNEYLETLNDEQLADLKLQRHKVELAQAKVEYVLESGHSIKN